MDSYPYKVLVWAHSFVACVLALLPLPLPTHTHLSTRACSDLHPYHEREKGLVPGTIVGHEFCGVVEECGSEVRVVGSGQTQAVLYHQQHVSCTCTHACVCWLAWCHRLQQSGPAKVSRERPLEGLFGVCLVVGRSLCSCLPLPWLISMLMLVVVLALLVLCVRVWC